MGGASLRLPLQSAGQGGMSCLLQLQLWVCWPAWWGAPSLVGSTQPGAQQGKQMSGPSHLNIGEVHAVEVTQHLVDL